MHGNYKYTNITTNTTTQVEVAQGKTLVCITINTAAAGSIKIIDGSSGTTANVGTIKASAAEGTYWYNVSMPQGIRIVTAAATDITVVTK